jgi:hypothetical protein
MQVGSGVGPGEAQIDVNDASMLRDFLAYDFFRCVPARTPKISESFDQTQFGKGFHRAGNVSLDRDLFAAAILKHVDMDSWHATIALAKYRRSPINNGSQRIESQYRIGVIGNTILQATREVRVLRSVGELTVDDIANQQDLDVQRKAFQLPMTVDDCGDVMGALERVAKRVQVLS